MSALYADLAKDIIQAVRERGRQGQIGASHVTAFGGPDAARHPGPLPVGAQSSPRVAFNFVVIVRETILSVRRKALKSKHGDAYMQCSINASRSQQIGTSDP